MIKKIAMMLMLASIFGACAIPAVQSGVGEKSGKEGASQTGVLLAALADGNSKEVEESGSELTGEAQDVPAEDQSDEQQEGQLEDEQGAANQTEVDETAVQQTGAINPLSGLPVQDARNLLLPPALVSITNFPPTARPQAGLSYSPVVFELYIGDGMTRYLAIFYGDFPQSDQILNDEDFQTKLSEGLQDPEPEPVVGPIRSGRLPYESVRKLFNGFIVMASAYSKVADQLSDYVNVFGDDNMDVNSALIPVEDLEHIAQANESDLGEASLNSMVFETQNPDGGKIAPSLWIFYAYKNQVFWRYNAADGAYHRWQDNADGVTFIEQTDRLNGDPITYENVIVLFADHDVQNQTMIDIDLLYVKRGKALLFRDGTMHEIYWTTKSEEYEKTTGKLRPIRFIDADGNPFPLKPGQTWIELVPNYTVYWETVDSEKYNQLVAGRSKGSGYWGLYFELDD